MAKKKGRRSANVARKREKRKRGQKSRQKQIAVEKQRRLRHEKSEEEHLHACISQSRELLLEPELEGVLFDPELMYTQVMELLIDYDVGNSDPATHESIDANRISVTNVLDEAAASKEQFTSTSEAEQACENFQIDVLPHLVTPKFMRHLCQALTACETRLKLIGNRKLAEVAYVTRSLFEAAPPEILAFHPMVQTIGIETLRVLVEEQDLIIEWRDGVKEILSDVLEHEDLETYPTQQISAYSGTHPETAIPETVSQPLGLSPDDLPARALYKNFGGLAIKACFEELTDETSAQNEILSYALVSESEDQVEFVDQENERYLRVTEERLQLHARSEAELSIAMAEVEARCTSALMYLAKTIKERG